MQWLVRSVQDSPIFQYVIRRICVHLHTDMGRGQRCVGSRNLQMCSVLARKIRSGFAWFQLPRNAATKKQSDALFSQPNNGAFMFPMEQMGKWLLSGEGKCAGVWGLAGVLLLRKIRVTCQTQRSMTLCLKKML